LAGYKIAGWKRLIISAGICLIGANIINAELPSLHVDPIEDPVLNIIFAEGASAGVCGSDGKKNGAADKDEFELFHDQKFRFTEKYRECLIGDYT
jgi:hypothetical protein